MARVRSSAENAFSTRRRFSSGIVAKKTSSPMSAMFTSGFELQGGLGFHGYYLFGEQFSGRLDPVPRGFQLLVGIGGYRGLRLGEYSHRRRSQNRAGERFSSELHGSLLMGQYGHPLLLQGF